MYKLKILTTNKSYIKTYSSMQITKTPLILGTKLSKDKITISKIYKKSTKIYLRPKRYIVKY